MFFSSRPFSLSERLKPVTGRDEGRIPPTTWPPFRPSCVYCRFFSAFFRFCPTSAFFLLSRDTLLGLRMRIRPVSPAPHPPPLAFFTRFSLYLMTSPDVLSPFLTRERPGGLLLLRPRLALKGRRFLLFTLLFRRLCSSLFFPVIFVFSLI